MTVQYWLEVEFSQAEIEAFDSQACHWKRICKPLQEQVLEIKRSLSLRAFLGFLLAFAA